MMRRKGAFAAVSSLLLSFGILWAEPAGVADVTINRDGTLLEARVYLAHGEGTFPTVVLLQGFPGSEGDVLGIGHALAKAGINAVTFNYSGTFQSQGENNFENTQKDVRAAFEYIRRPENVRKFAVDTTRIYLGGWSYGGGMALTYAAGHPDVKVVFSVAGTDHGEFMREYARDPDLKRSMDAAFDGLSAPAGPVRFAKDGKPKDVAAMDVIASIPALDLRRSAPLLAPKDILLVGGWDDPNVTIGDYVLPLYRALEKAGAKNVRIVAFQDGHGFEHHRKVLARTIIDWLREVPGRATKSAASPDD